MLMLFDYWISSNKDQYYQSQSQYFAIRWSISRYSYLKRLIEGHEKNHMNLKANPFRADNVLSGSHFLFEEIYCHDGEMFSLLFQ